jgi:hypothetical protein
MRLDTFERDGARILECADAIGPRDALELVVACLEHDATRLLVESRFLPPEFFDLKTGFAGELLQKMQNYGIRLAGVFPSEEGSGERFRELLREARRGRGFRAFAAREDAEVWLASE